MRHQSGEGETAKKRVNGGSSSANLPREKDREAEVLAGTSIDPTDLFDPEEFGYRRKQKLSGE